LASSLWFPYCRWIENIPGSGVGVEHGSSSNAISPSGLGFAIRIQAAKAKQIAVHQVRRHHGPERQKDIFVAAEKFIKSRIMPIETTGMLNEQP
jgi:hypothetical protein